MQVIKKYFMKILLEKENAAVSQDENNTTVDPLNNGFQRKSTIVATALRRASLADPQMMLFLNQL